MQSPRKLYLTIHNTLFFALWISVLYATISNFSNGKAAVFDATEQHTRCIQTATLVEIIHSAIGLVKSPVSTTFIQVTTRVIQVWMIWYSFPSNTASSYAYETLVFAWSCADAIRYAYLAFNVHGRCPGWLSWLRYTIFYPLYPIAWWVLKPLFWFLLSLYVPGAWNMYTYMIKQRRKILGGKRKET
ncbi:PTPLA-domain-containing protein [Setomelanomma holmii]|uniref:Very-long-chain (3R)-3-hydroxyacyl-CoA dehydratase n=1 Tax=Setomelanomma holmii TaxID=210430 RepID=A0A9P4H4A9_9PLEO|nr:PTPLA-domain-containing protein [Setomelanomma holmii]